MNPKNHCGGIFLIIAGLYSALAYSAYFPNAGQCHWTSLECIFETSVIHFIAPAVGVHRARRRDPPGGFSNAGRV